VLATFIPIAALITVTPGAGTAMVVRSSMRGGWRAGVLTIAGNEVGVVVWGLLSVLGVSALVAASEIAFLALKVTGAAVLLWLGVQSLRRARTGGAVPDRTAPRRPGGHRAFRAGVVTSLANPKLAVFFVALFPQFVDGRSGVLAVTLLMATLIVAFDFVWYTAIAVAVSRSKRAYSGSRLARSLEAATGVVLVGLGLRIALEPR
jgi:threonine/homoserine/homoserine lactone efflux protein